MSIVLHDLLSGTSQGRKIIVANSLICAQMWSRLQFSILPLIFKSRGLESKTAVAYVISVVGHERFLT